MAAVRNGIVEWSARTSGTRVRPPQAGLFRGALETNVRTTGDFGLRALSLLLVAREGSRTSASKARASLARFTGRDRRVDCEAKQAEVRQRLNAIVGYAIGKLPKGSSVEELYQRALEGLMNRSDRDPDLLAAMSHPEFMTYVLARVYERAEP